MLLLLAGCIENALNGPGKPDGRTETGVVVETDSGSPEACNGVDDDGDGLLDEGFPDDDENGRADCMDGTCDTVGAPAAGVDAEASCDVVTPIDDPWNVARLWTFGGPDEDPSASSSRTQPLIAHLADRDGDGDLDADDGVDIVIATFGPEGAGWLVVLDGATGAEAWAVEGVSPFTQVATGDIDGNGTVEVLAYDRDGFLFAREGDGALLWTSSAAAPPAVGGWQVLVADLDGDGAPEVVADILVLEGATGAVKAQLAVDTDTHQHRAPTVGDLDGDGEQEILLAGRVFEADGTEVWYSGEGVEDGVWSALVQLDGDDAAEVLTLGANLVLSDTDGTTLIRSPTFARNWSGGPCVGDFDGDGEPEMAYGAYDAFYVRDMDLRNVASFAIQELSGLAACAGYDLDGDGALEVLYADETAFRIADGRTGAALFTDTGGYGSIDIYASPAVGDLDGDGDVEVLLASSDTVSGLSLIAYTNAGEGWPAVTTTWPVFDYSVWNQDADGAVPRSPGAPWLLGNGVRTAPVNPRTLPAPDLTVQFTGVCVNDCVYGPVAVAVQVSNVGTADAPAGATLALYALDGADRRRVATSTVDALPAGQAAVGVVFELAPADVGADGFVAVVDDGRAVSECGEANNEAVDPSACR